MSYDRFSPGAAAYRAAAAAFLNGGGQPDLAPMTTGGDEEPDLEDEAPFSERHREAADDAAARGDGSSAAGEEARGPTPAILPRPVSQRGRGGGS